MEANDGKWVGLFAKNTGLYKQTYISLDNWDGIRRVIKDKWKDGYRLTMIEYGEGRWFTLFSKTSGKSAEAYNGIYGWERFRKDLKTYWKAGYDIVSISSGWYD